MNKGRRIVPLMITLLLCLQIVPAASATEEHQSMPEAANSNSTAVSDDIYTEVTNSITFQYCNGTGWKDFSSVTEKEDVIDGVRIVTGDKPYRFLYKTKHEDTIWQERRRV